jgi:hypothetical protein
MYVDDGGYIDRRGLAFTSLPLYPMTTGPILSVTDLNNIRARRTSSKKGRIPKSAYYAHEVAYALAERLCRIVRTVPTPRSSPQQIRFS